ncbi:MAG TPA: hypothetical protein VFK86_08655 [Bauldia sp.]|nr:hypothetical protein [Bauldia sp.]
MTVQVSRRDVILTAVRAAIASVGAAGFPPALFAQTTVTPAAFLALSETLTATPNLDPGTATTILGGFLATGHGDEIAKLIAEGYDPVTPLANAIVAAWYSGVYTTMPKDDGSSPAGTQVEAVATFTQALLWNALTFSKPWGVCGGDTGYWADPPKA